MRMTLEADYAVRIVECLTLAGKRCEAAYIAERAQVPLRFSLKILRKLVQEGLVVSYKGCLLYTSPSPRDGLLSRMPSSA